MRLTRALIRASMSSIASVSGAIAAIASFFLVGGSPVAHRPHGRRRRFSALVGGESRDELLDIQGLVMSQAGIGLPRQVRGGMRTQRADRFGQVSPLGDRREQRDGQGLVVDGLRV